MNPRAKSVPSIGELGSSAFHSQIMTISLSFAEPEGVCPQRLAAEAERFAGSSALIVTAWSAFEAWSQAQDDRYRAWVDAHKLLVQRQRRGSSDAEGADRS